MTGSFRGTSIKIGYIVEAWGSKGCGVGLGNFFHAGIGRRAGARHSAVFCAKVRFEGEMVRSDAGYLVVAKTAGAHQIASESGAQQKIVDPLVAPRPAAVVSADVTPVVARTEVEKTDAEDPSNR